MSLLVACILLPLLSFALPSSHIHSFHARAPHRPRVMTYFADWAPPHPFNCSLYDIVIYAFALPDQNFQLAWDSEEAPTQLADLVPIAHAASTLVSLSIGGWTGSRQVYLVSPPRPSQPLQVFLRRSLNTTEQGHLHQQHRRCLQAIQSRWHRRRLGVPRSGRPTGKRRKSRRRRQHAPVLQRPSKEA